MQSKDLRIGNDIQNKNGFEMFVVGIYDDEILCNFQENQGDVFEYDVKDLKPIQIHTEFLENRANFKLSYDGGYFHELSLNGEFIFKVSIDSDGCWYYVSDLGIAKKIDGFHELQNLYFALTGEELELKQEPKP